MEKKIYEKPVVAVASIETESFIAASIDLNLNSNQEIGGSDMKSKKSNGLDLWGDDTEE